MLNELDGVLPAIPPKVQVEQLNPRPYKLPRILFGKLMPKPEDEEDKKKKKNKNKHSALKRMGKGFNQKIPLKPTSLGSIVGDTAALA